MGSNTQTEAYSLRSQGKLNVPRQAASFVNERQGQAQTLTAAGGGGGGGGGGGWGYQSIHHRVKKLSTSNETIPIPWYRGKGCETA